MRKYLLTAAAAAAFVATPAFADGPYVGIEGGIMFPEKQDVFGTVVFTNPGTPGPVNYARTKVGQLDYSTGIDADIIGGYDLGMFRIEGELGYKRASIKDAVTFDNGFVTAINTGAGTTYTTNATLTDFDLENHTDVYSAMINGLIDFGGNGFGAYAGGGVGYADVHQFGDSQGKFAWQLIAGAYVPVSSNVNIGLKYRYFQTDNLDFSNTYAFAAGNGICTGFTCSPGTVTFDTNRHFSSHSLLASLVFNFGAPAVVEAAPPPPPPPPPPPATQTCPDGSVIDATATCPVPPPPPPPPPAPVERGERGQ